MAIRFEPAVLFPTTAVFTADQNQTIYIGDPVVLVNGKVQKATASSSNLLGVAATSVTTGSGENADIVVWVGDDHNEFYGVCSGSPAITLLGSTCDIELSSGVPRVNEDADSVHHLKVVGKHPADSWGSSGARVRFKINPAISQYSA